MGMPGIGELIVIFLIVLLVFGAGKIPKIAKDIGSGIREFKKSVSGENETTSTTNGDHHENKDAKS
jgi:sec-independent protein translocase protein TatA